MTDKSPEARDTKLRRIQIEATLGSGRRVTQAELDADIEAAKREYRRPETVPYDIDGLERGLTGTRRRENAAPALAADEALIKKGHHNAGEGFDSRWVDVWLTRVTERLHIRSAQLSAVLALCDEGKAHERGSEHAEAYTKAGHLVPPTWVHTEGERLGYKDGYEDGFAFGAMWQVAEIRRAAGIKEGE